MLRAASVALEAPSAVQARCDGRVSMKRGALVGYSTPGPKENEECEMTGLSNKDEGVRARNGHSSQVTDLLDRGWQSKSQREQSDRTALHTSHWRVAGAVLVAANQRPYRRLSARGSPGSFRTSRERETRPGSPPAFDHGFAICRYLE